MFPIKESLEELVQLEKRYSAMISRLRWLRALKGNPNIGVQLLADQVGVPVFELERWAEFYIYGGIDLLLNPQTILEKPLAQGMTFSEHAEEKMLELFNKHPNEYGRRLWIEFESCRDKNKSIQTECSLFENYKDFETEFGNLRKWSRTDCISYIQNVMRYALEKMGKKKFIQKYTFRPWYQNGSRLGNAWLEGLFVYAGYREPV